MAISNFISTVWSESLLSALDGKYIGVANCNREFEGDIKNRGDRVKICGVGPVTVFNYTKNTDFSSGAEALSDSEKTLVIDQAKAFNFMIDDIDMGRSKGGERTILFMSGVAVPPGSILPQPSYVLLRSLACG